MNFSPPKRIAILYSDARPEYFPTREQFITEVEVKSRAAIIASYLTKKGVNVATFPGNADISENLKRHHPDFVINLVDSVYGQEYLSATIPAALELLRIPYTGSGIMGKTIDTNKFFAKNLLDQWGLTTPKYQLIKDKNDEIEVTLDYPLISKLNEIHGSVEINDSAVSENKKSLKRRINYLMDNYQQPVLLEEFIMGREISVIVFEGLKTKLYAAEKIFDPTTTGKYQIASFDAVWNESPEYNNSISYQKYELPDRVKNQIKTAFDILKMEDYAKFDLRVDTSNRHYFIDCNNNPALGPRESYCAIGTILNLYDISFDEILDRLIKNTLSQS